MSSKFFQLNFASGRNRVKGNPHFAREHRVRRSDNIRVGIWSKWDWDGATLTASNCRFGMVPLYYFEKGDTFCISDSIETLLECGAPQELDDVGLSVFIRRQNFVGEDTPFKSIRCLAPNSRLTWSEGRLNIESAPFRSSPQHLKPAAILEGIHELFAQSIARRLPKSNRFTVPLSGGKESRRILFELARQSHLPEFCVTAMHPPPRANEDAKVSALITERLGIEQRLIPAEWASIALEKDKNRRMGFSTLEHNWVVPMARYLPSAVDCSYDGINIDCNLYSDKRARLFGDGKLTELAIDILGDSEATLSQTLSAETYKLLSRDKAIHRVVEDLKLHAEQVCPTSSFLFWSRMRRAVAPVPFGLLHDIETVHTPFLDKELFEFSMSIPEPILVGGQVYREAIEKSYPEWRDIPYADSSLSTQPNRQHNRRYLTQLCAYLADGNLRSRIIDVPRTLPRILKGAVSGSQERFGWIQPQLITFLLQLEGLARG
ncbi:hypothetical protein [Pelagibius sp. Alg239-R121]|uniref:hypothetical protein n=1 Tax=Pelagibius sp. Alg239-R121 TaxID=2993448 RepID=UPI0024A6B814|nr:hypothetical protein [Pelagibius sp. Alg239-R121]